MIPLFFGKIINDKIELSRQLEFDVLKKRLEGKEIALTLQRRPRKRSKRHNAYYFAALVEFLATEFGNSVKETHGILKRELLVSKTHFKGKEQEYILSTRDFTTEEFNMFIESVKRWSAEQGVYIPDSDELLDGKLEEEIKLKSAE